MDEIQQCVMQEKDAIENVLKKKTLYAVNYEQQKRISDSE